MMNIDPKLYDFQKAGVEDALAFLFSASIGQGRLYKSPTGSGKSYMEKEILRLFDRRIYLTVPSIEIGIGVYKKLYPESKIEEWSEANQRTGLEGAHIFTIRRLHGLILAGEVPLPDAFIHDEAHHSVDNTTSDVWDLCGKPPRVAFTATDFRGTPKETERLRATYNYDIKELLSLRDAVKRGIIAQPHFSVWPLINDDTIDLVNGEFHVGQLDSAIKKVVPDIAHRINQYYDRQEERYDRATVVTLPTQISVELLSNELHKLRLPFVVVVGGTSFFDRQRAFAQTIDQESVLLQIKVVGEGVDLPIRRMIDLSPTMSPVLWQQRVGRITRPTEETPEYIACNHNLTRHAYLWRGLIPASTIREAQQVWGPKYKPTRRSMSRALGIEGFGRFKVIEVPLLDGTLGQMYALQTKDGTKQWVVFGHPAHPSPLYFTRDNTRGEREKEFITPSGQKVKYREWVPGKWHRIKKLEDVVGCVSMKADAISEKQEDWWHNDAATYGLAPDAEVDSRIFQILPVLKDTRIKIKQVEE